MKHRNLLIATVVLCAVSLCSAHFDHEAALSNLIHTASKARTNLRAGPTTPKVCSDAMMSFFFIIQQAECEDATRFEPLPVMCPSMASQPNMTYGACCSESSLSPTCNPGFECKKSQCTKVCSEDSDCPGDDMCDGCFCQPNFGVACNGGNFCKMCPNTRGVVTPTMTSTAGCAVESKYLFMDNSTGIGSDLSAKYTLACTKGTRCMASLAESVRTLISPTCLQASKDSGLVNVDPNCPAATAQDLYILELLASACDSNANGGNCLVEIAYFHSHWGAYASPRCSSFRNMGGCYDVAVRSATNANNTEMVDLYHNACTRCYDSANAGPGTCFVASPDSGSPGGIMVVIIIGAVVGVIVVVAIGVGVFIFFKLKKSQPAKIRLELPSDSELSL